MTDDKRNKLTPKVSFDGGKLDCGNGLLLLIRRHIDPLDQGELLEILSQESSVEEDLPAWCRLTGNELLALDKEDDGLRFLVSKGSYVAGNSGQETSTFDQSAPLGLRVEVKIPDSLPSPQPAPAIRPLSTMIIGSWPRPPWMRQAIHAHMEGRLDEKTFQETADDAVRLVVAAQLNSGAGVVTDGEQRRDSYSSFVGGILDNTQLIPLTDLSAMVEDPEEFNEELRALDVPAGEVRHPVVFGKLGRSKPIACHELDFAKTLTDTPIKVSLPGPYLLTRTMWLDCLLEKAYLTREELANDIVRVLREELFELLSKGAALVQFDEPVLTEVVFTGPKAARSFMCGALSEKGAAGDELAFALELMNRVIEGAPRERTGLHICRGNWTKDEGALLAGDYRPLGEFLRKVRVGTLFLEFSTPRAGEIAALGELNLDHRIGLGVVNPRGDEIEAVEDILKKAEEAISLFGAERLLLNSDCGFATFADNPVASSETAQKKLLNMAAAAQILRDKYLS